MAFQPSHPPWGPHSGRVWIPPDTETIQRATADGSLEETHSFDGKREMPSTDGKRVDLACDVCAMTVDGGVLLYGVDEDEAGRLVVDTPIDLGGAAERVDQIVQTGIAEVPLIRTRRYELPDDPSRGYLAVIVPRSARAPHMVIVKGRNRYYARGEKGHRVLGEAEVARLYARRGAWSVSDAALLADVVLARPSEAGPGPAVHAFARPLAADDRLLAVPTEDRWGPTQQTLFGEVQAQVGDFGLQYREWLRLSDRSGGSRHR